MPFCTRPFAIGPISERWRVDSHTARADDFLSTDLTGGGDGAVSLWQYRQMQPLFGYRAADGNRVTALRFSLFGVKFGATDAAGQLSLYNFEARQEGVTPYQVRRLLPVGRMQPILVGSPVSRHLLCVCAHHCCERRCSRCTRRRTISSSCRRRALSPQPASPRTKSACWLARGWGGGGVGWWVVGGGTQDQDRARPMAPGSDEGGRRGRAPRASCSKQLMGRVSAWFSSHTGTCACGTPCCLRTRPASKVGDRATMSVAFARRTGLQLTQRPAFRRGVGDTAFVVHEGGCLALAYSASKNLLISASRKGELRTCARSPCNCSAGPGQLTRAHGSLCRCGS